MPHNVRNVWITTTVDGRSASVGPRAASGGATISIQQRDHGQETHALTIEVFPDGQEIILTIFDHKGTIVHRHSTQR